MTRGAYLKAVVLGAFILAGLLWWAEDSRPSIPDSLAVTIDSLSVTQPAFDSGVLVRLADAERRAARIEGLQMAAGQARREAQAERSRADSLTRHAATSVDSGGVWKAAHDARQAEALAWQQRGDSLQLALDHSTARGDSLQSVADMALVRLTVTSDALTDLRGVFDRQKPKWWQRCGAVGGIDLRGKPNAMLGCRLWP